MSFKRDRSFASAGPGVWNRGVRVYPYPRVYPTRPVPAGMGRVRVDVLRVGSGRVRVRSPRVGYIRFLPVKITIFYDVGAISNVFIYFFLFSEREPLYVVVRPSVCRLSVCRL